VMKLITVTALVCGVVGIGSNFVDARPVELQARSRIDDRASRPLRAVTLPPASGGCHTRMMNGFPIPDPNCTPGAINPTITVAVLRNPAFRTACIPATHNRARKGSDLQLVLNSASGE
jgi:hypothetical protein